MKMTLEERETNIYFDEADKVARILSYNARLNKRLRELAEKRPEDVKPIKEYFDDENGAICFEFPSAWLKINPTRASTMSEEERAERAERMKAINRRRKEAEANDNNI